MLVKDIGESLIRNTWVEIDLDSIKHNLIEARRYIKPETKIAGVIKANAYGHGAVPIAKALIKNGIDMLAVACLAEAIEVRKHCPEIPILIMGHTVDNKLKLAVEQDITTTIFNLEQAKILSELGASLKKEAVVHIKINTGFNRIGVNIDKDIIDTITAIYGLRNLKVEGIFTHFALKTSDTDKAQYDLFMDLINKLESNGVIIPIKHICDSIGMVAYPDYHLDMIRLGSFMYGVKTELMDDGVLILGVNFKTQISHINEIKKGEGVGYGYSFMAERDTLVGTLPVGYSDGYMRCLGNKGEVSIKGKKAPVIGKICMDQCMIDLTDIPEAKIGDEVVLLGESSKDIVRLADIAEKVDTNRNEILSIIGRRVPRVYIENNEVVQVIDYLLD